MCPSLELRPAKYTLMVLCDIELARYAANSCNLLGGIGRVNFALISVQNFSNCLKPAVYVRLVAGAMASPRKCHRSWRIELSRSEGVGLVWVCRRHEELGDEISPPGNEKEHQL